MRPRQKLAAVLLFSTAPLVTGCITDDDMKGETQAQQEPLDEVALIELRDELVETPATEALERFDHFRALCDRDGYPLVGNVATKSIGMQPSQCCAEARK
jgi:hypothetical protein